MPAPLLRPKPDVTRHTLIEDVQGLSTGVIMCSLGIFLLAHQGFITGQTAGLALIISYLTGWSFGTVFFLVNLPFYWLAYYRLGARFTVKSLICVAALSRLTDVIPAHFQITHLDPLLCVLFFGTVTGIGLLALFRHGGSLGGLGVVAFYMQERFGFRAGYVQLIVDACIFAVAFFLFPFSTVAWSLLGALILNGLIAFNHRRDRYIAS